MILLGWWRSVGHLGRRVEQLWISSGSSLVLSRLEVEEHPLVWRVCLAEKLSSQWIIEVGQQTQEEH